MKKLTSEVFDFIAQNRAAAFATSSKQNIPHVATVFCVADDDLTIYFATRVESRKFRNLSAQPVVSMAFTNEKLMETVELTGTAKRVESLPEEQEILYRLVTLRHQERNQEPPPMQL